MTTRVGLKGQPYIIDLINSYFKKISVKEENKILTIKEETAIPEGYKEKQLNSDDDG